MVYAHKLRELRDAKGLSNHELAELSGVPESTLCRILTGQTDSPGLQTVCDIAKVLDGDMNEICGFKIASENKKTSPENYISEEVYRERIAHIQSLADKLISDKNKWLTRMFVYCCALTALVLLVIFIDILTPGVGYIR